MTKSVDPVEIARNKQTPQDLLCSKIFYFTFFGLLTLLHSEQPKLHRVLAILSAKGFRINAVPQYLLNITVSFEMGIMDG